MLGPRGKADTGPSGHLPLDRADQYTGIWGADKPLPIACGAAVWDQAEWALESSPGAAGLAGALTRGRGLS